MENYSTRNNRFSQLHSSNSLRQRRSGYEPSDTETDWQETPQHHQNQKNGSFAPGTSQMDLDLPRKVSPMRHGRRHSSKFDESSPKKESVASPPRRRNSSKSPYKAWRDDGVTVLPMSSHRNISPLLKSENGRQVSPYKYGGDGHEHDAYANDETAGSNRRKYQRTPTREERGSQSQIGGGGRVSERSASSVRTTSAPKTRMKKYQENGRIHRELKGDRTPSPLPRTMIHNQSEREASHARTPSEGELNEMVANIKMSESRITNASYIESTSESIGDIFFSHHYAGLVMKKNGLAKKGDNGIDLYPTATNSQVNSVLHQQSKANGSIGRNFQQSKAKGNIGHNLHRILTSNSSRTTMTSSSVVSGQSSGKFNGQSSKMSDASGSFKTFVANRKNQADTWFSCMRGPCRTSKSPEKRQLDEASFIEKAFVVESLRQFWADKHQPLSLNGFTCHKQETQLLKQLVSYDSVPHILFKGPSGSGKRALAMALLGEIFGDPCRNISHDLRYFQVQDKRATQVVVPIASSVHHVELNVNLEPNAKYALMGVVKEISNTYAAVPEVSNVNFKPDYKVLVLYEVDKAAENIQHLIKWIMDCYTDACKLILCCEDDVDILESVKNRCKVIKVDAPVTHEIMEVLTQIARKEDFDLPMNFAAQIATKSKQNLRKAIMALEACKAHNYPFADDQPIPFGWEEVLLELAAEILTDPSPDKLFFARGKLQKLLVDFVHPRLILLKLIEQLLKGVEASSKRELYYWHAYYDKRLPTGTTALLKLEEFVAKFMSIHRGSSVSRQYV